MALITAIQVSHFQEDSTSNFKLVNKGTSSKGRSSNCGRGKGRGVSILNGAKAGGYVSKFQFIGMVLHGLAFKLEQFDWC